MTPTDLTAFITRQESVEKQYRAVVLDRDEELVFRNAGGYTMLLPVPLCQHKHRQIEKAARCGLKAADKMRRAADGPERLHGGDLHTANERLRQALGAIEAHGASLDSDILSVQSIARAALAKDSTKGGEDG